MPEKKTHTIKYIYSCVTIGVYASKSYTNYYFIMIDKSVNMLLTNLDSHLVIASEEPLN